MFNNYIILNRYFFNKYFLIFGYDKRKKIDQGTYGVKLKCGEPLALGCIEIGVSEGQPADNEVKMAEELPSQCSMRVFQRAAIFAAFFV